MIKAFVEFGVCYGGTNLPSFLKEGWHGIFVEPHPLNIVKAYESLLSLGDVSFDFYESIVVPDESQIVTFKSGSPTFSELGYSAEVGGTQSSTWNAGHWEKHKGPGLKIAPVTLDRLVQESPYPVERFEIDCEGMELDIFKSYSWIKKPQYIKVAIHGDVKDRLYSIILEQGYELVNNEECVDSHFRRIV